MQVLAIEVVMHAEWIEKQSADPLVQRVRREYAAGLYDDDAPAAEGGGGEEDLSQIRWQSPSDMGDEETALNEIEMFNQAMAASHMTVADEDGGEWL